MDRQPPSGADIDLAWLPVPALVVRGGVVVARNAEARDLLEFPLLDELSRLLAEDRTLVLATATELEALPSPSAGNGPTSGGAAAGARRRLTVRTASGPPRRYFDLSLSPHPAGGVLVIAVEATERERLDAAVAELATGVIATDSDLQVTWLPHRVAETLGLRRDAVRGRPVFDLVHPDDVGRAHELIDRARSNPGVRCARPLRVQHPDQPDVHWPVVAHVVWRGAEDAIGGLLVRFDMGLAADLHLHDAEQAAQGLVTVGDASPLGSLHIGMNGGLLQRSTRVREMLAPLGADGDLRWLELLRPVDRAGVAERMAAARMGALLPPIEVAFEGRGLTIWARLDVLPYHDARSQVAGMFVNLLDVTAEHLARDELTSAREELWHLANHDALTGLANRHLFNDRLAAAVVGAGHHDGAGPSATRPAVLVCDLDRFKEVNDANGHRVGDAVLIEAARRLESAVRGADLVCRFGGDEFLVLCERVADEEELIVVAHRIIERFALPFFVDHLTLDVGVSVGGAMAEPGDTVDPDALVLRADRAMYAAKAAGRGRMVIA